MLKTLNGIRLIRFEPELHSKILYHWYYSGDYPEFYRNHPVCPSLAEVANSALGKAFMILKVDDSSIIGCIMHFAEKEFARNFEAGCLIDKTVQNNGYGITALKILLDWKFNNCNLFKVKVNVVYNNKRVVKIVEDFGMILEGVNKKEDFYDAEFHDVAVYAMFKMAFNKRYKNEFEPQEARLGTQQLREFSNVRVLASAV